MDGRFGEVSDLRTAQDRVHAFLAAASHHWRRSGLAVSLASDPDRQRALERETERLLFQLLDIPARCVLLLVPQALGDSL